MCTCIPICINIISPSLFGRVITINHVAKELMRIAIPLDFLPLKAKLNEEELHKYLANYKKYFDRRPLNDAARNEPDIEVTPESVTRKLNAMKSCIMEVSRNEIKDHFALCFRTMYPDFRYRKTRTVNSIPELTEALRHCSYDATIRGICFQALHGMWEKNNAWANPIEDKIMEILMIEYTCKMFDGMQMQRNHAGGCVKRLIVMQKNSMLVPIKNYLKTCQNESLCVRNRTGLIAVRVDDDGSETFDATGVDEHEDNDDDDMSTEDVDGAQKKKRKTTRPKGLCKILLCNPNVHGCQGYLCQFDRHSDLSKDKKFNTPMKQKERSVMEYLDAKMNDNEPMTKAQIFAMMTPQEVSPTPDDSFIVYCDLNMGSNLSIEWSYSKGERSSKAPECSAIVCIRS